MIHLIQRQQKHPNFVGGLIFSSFRLASISYIGSITRAPNKYQGNQQKTSYLCDVSTSKARPVFCGAYQHEHGLGGTGLVYQRDLSNSRRGSLLGEVRGGNARLVFGFRLVDLRIAYDIRNVIVNVVISVVMKILKVMKMKMMKVMKVHRSTWPLGEGLPVVPRLQGLHCWITSRSFL